MSGLVERTIERIEAGISNCEASKCRLGYNDLDMRNLARLTLSGWPHVKAEIERLTRELAEARVFAAKESESANKLLSKGLDLCDLQEATEQRAARIEKALDFILDGYSNPNINHVDFRVGAYQAALDALGEEAPEFELITASIRSSGGSELSAASQADRGEK